MLPASYITEHLLHLDLISKNPELLIDGAKGLGLTVFEENGILPVEMEEFTCRRPWSNYEKKGIFPSLTILWDIFQYADGCV